MEGSGLCFFIYKCYLPIVSCDYPSEMDLSILDRLDPYDGDLQFLGKLIFTAFVWHIWRERNSRIFKNKASHPSDTLNVILKKVRSRLVSFGYNFCQTSLQVSRICFLQFLTFGLCIHRATKRKLLSHFSYSSCVGEYFWRDKDDPTDGVIKSSLDFYCSTMMFFS